MRGGSNVSSRTRAAATSASTSAAIGRSSPAASASRSRRRSGATKVGTPAADDAFMLSSHNDPVTPGTYSHDDRSAPLGAAAAVQVTLDATGTPSQGSGIAFVSYSLPLS